MEYHKHATFLVYQTVTPNYKSMNWLHYFHRMNHDSLVTYEWSHSHICYHKLSPSKTPSNPTPIKSHITSHQTCQTPGYQNLWHTPLIHYVYIIPTMISLCHLCYKLDCNAQLCQKRLQLILVVRIELDGWWGRSARQEYEFFLKGSMFCGEGCGIDRMWWWLGLWFSLH